MVYVVGSGPAGVSAAFALLQQGCEVTLLDAGIELEHEKQAMLHVMEQQPRGEWSSRALQSFQVTGRMGAGGMPLKYVYGSDFLYRKTEKYTPLESNGVQILASLAKGGLSNAWGASVLSYPQSEITDWPLTENDLAEHYRALHQFLPLSAHNDNLTHLFPLYSEKYFPLEISAQVNSFLTALTQAEEILHRQGMLFGQARLAVHNAGSKGRACSYCGLCMYGCPHRLIYSAADTLKELLHHPRFQYKGGIVAETVREESEQVVLQAQHITSGERVSFSGSKVFLACGVLGTAKILLTSLQALNTPVELKTSQHFLIPLLRRHGAAGVQKADKHTLAQLFIEVRDEHVSKHLIHLQVYGYMDLFEKIIQNKLKALYLPLRWGFERFFYGRFLLMQGYLHSEESCSIRLTLPQSGIFQAEPVENPRSRDILAALRRKINTLRGLLQLFPVGPGVELSPAGVGAHLGGTFPMKREPQKLETDVLGRPRGFHNIHIVDSSVFPSIPATTITYAMMANAHRIASESLKI